MNNVERMREASGHVESSSKLVVFLYLLMRDHLPVGEIERIMLEVSADSMPVTYTNGWLAQHCKDIEKRLNE
jgi:hypothetical protein